MLALLPPPPVFGLFHQNGRILSNIQNFIFVFLFSVAAYVACGGNADKTGHVDRDVISRIIKVDFGLDIDIDKMMDFVDHDGSGEMEFGEFEQLLSGKASVSST